MREFPHITAPVVCGIIVFGIGGWLFIRALWRSEDPKRLVFKLLLTVPGVVGMAALGHTLEGALGRGLDYGLAFFCATSAALLGLYLAAIWRHNIADFVARPIENLFTGGDRESEPKAFYSIAVAKRKRGHYAEAVAEIQKELEKFPKDFEGQLLLAEIQAEDLDDLPGAELTIERLCAQSGHSPRNIAAALNWLADCHLKIRKDRDAACRALEKMGGLFPDSEWSALAAQRVAHLAVADRVFAPLHPKKFAVTEGVQNLGLLDPRFHPKPAETDVAKEAAELVEHLGAHPLDTEAREKLALIYADHYDRLDLAARELEQLIANPNQPAKRIAHWLNMLADLQVRHGANEETVRGTLRRIIEWFPNSAAAHLAGNRLVRVKLELKANKKSQTAGAGSRGENTDLTGGSVH